MSLQGHSISIEAESSSVSHSDFARASKNPWDQSWRTAPPDGSGWLIETLLGLILLFTPFAFGAVEPWAEWVVALLSGMLGSTAAMRFVLNRELRPVRSWAFVPLVLFIALAAVQLVPLSEKILAVFSPATVQTRTQFLSDLPDASEQLKAFPLSMYPHATRHDLRLVLAASAIFFAVVNYYRTPDRIKRLLAWIAIIGAAAILVAFVQDLSGTTRIYFIGPQRPSAVTAGPFVLYSDYCQFINLCVGAALALGLLVLLRNIRRHRSRESAFRHSWRSTAFKPIWFLAVMIILGVTTIFLSNGRAGMLASLIGFGFVTLVLSKIKGLPGRAWLILPLVLMIFGVLAFIGLDLVFDRLATLKQTQTHGGRWEMLEDLTHVWRQFPLWGTGLGTHEVVYPRYDRSVILARATHAEDEYAQVIEETGFVGLGLVLWFVITIWCNFARALRKGETPNQLIATGLGFGLLAVMVHSFTDFGQHIPAVACLTAVVCGLMISVARLASPEKPKSVYADRSTFGVLTGSSVSGRLVSGGIAVVMTVVAAWVVLGAGQCYAAESEWKIAVRQEHLLSEHQWQGTPGEFKELMSHATVAVLLDPEEVEHRCFLNAYRWRMLEQAMAGETSASTDRKTQLRREARQILIDLDITRKYCPVYGPVYRFIAQIENNVFASPLADLHSQQAFELSQTDSTACLLAARADVKASGWNQSMVKFRRYLSLGGDFTTVMDVYLTQAKRPDLAIAIAQNNSSFLDQLAKTLRENPRYEVQVAQIDQRVYETVKQQASQKNASAGTLINCAQLSMQHHDLPTAIECYRRAIDLDFSQVDWHFALATLFKDTNQIPEAMREARICMRLRPQMAAAEKLLGDLSVLPTAPIQAEHAK